MEYWLRFQRTGTKYPNILSVYSILCNYMWVRIIKINRAITISICHLNNIGNSVVEMIQSSGHISTMGFHLLVRHHFHTETTSQWLEIWSQNHITAITAFLGSGDTSHQQDHCLPVISLTQLHLDKMAAILADDIFNCIFWNENDRIPIQISLKCVPRSTIDNESALVELWLGAEQATNHYLNQCWPSSLTYICDTRGR